MKKHNDDLFEKDEQKALDEYLYNRETRWTKQEDKKQENIKSVEPWQDENGNTLCDTKLKKVSIGWDEDTWERYLTSIEHYQREQLVDDYDAVVHKYGEQQALKDYLSDPDRKKENKQVALEMKVKELVFDLPFHEMTVIRALFYDGLSTRQIARKMSIGRTQVAVLRDRALARLKHNLEKIRAEKK